MPHKVTLLPGDGVGPIVCEVASTCIDALGVEVDWDLVSTADLDGAVTSVRRTGVMLKGRHRQSARPGEPSFTVRFRKAVGVWAIVRQAKNLPGLPARAQGVDIVTIREASEDIYAGFEHESTTGVFESVKVTTRAACERISRFAFEYARAHGRRRVTTVHKANILKTADGMFLRVSQEIAKGYPDIQHDEVIVDALCMNLVRRPQAFDVLLAGNLFGDIVSDCAAGMAGGIPVATGVCYADGVAIFENPHGATITQVGEDGADPYPALGLAVDLLRHLGETAAAQRLYTACVASLDAGLRTADIGGTATTSAIRAAVLDAIRAG
jgi:isocitrate dehydrogenase (NAD+)